MIHEKFFKNSQFIIKVECIYNLNKHFIQVPNGSNLHSLNKIISATVGTDLIYVISPN